MTIKLTDKIIHTRAFCTKEEIDHIIKCINAYDELMEFVKNIHPTFNCGKRKQKGLIKKYGDR